MKKFIALTSISLSIGFAIALANADDTKKESSSSTSVQDTGSNTGSTGTNMGTSGSTADTSTGTSGKKDMGMHDTCTDESGMTFKKGQKGFKECVKTMEKKKSGEMGGEKGTTTTEETYSTEEKSR